MITSQSSSFDWSVVEERRLGDLDPVVVPTDMEQVSRRLLDQSTLLIEIKHLSRGTSALPNSYHESRDAIAKGPLAEYVLSYHLDQTPFLSILQHHQQQQQQESAATSTSGGTKTTIRRKHFLFVAGGHGRLRAPFAFAREVPSYWKKRVIDPLFDLGIRFDVIVLDSCFSASWINEFSSLLMPSSSDGTSSSILLAHGSCSVCALSANILDFLANNGAALLKEAATANDTISYSLSSHLLSRNAVTRHFAPIVEDVFVSSLPRDYLTDFFYSKVVEHEGMHEIFDDLAAKYKMVAAEDDTTATMTVKAEEGSGEENSVEKEGAHHHHHHQQQQQRQLLQKLCRVHVSLLKPEMDSPTTWSPLYTWGEFKNKAQLEAEEEKEKKKKEREDEEARNRLDDAARVEAVNALAQQQFHLLPPDPAPPVFVYETEKAALQQRIVRVSTFLSNEFRNVVTVETKISSEEKVEQMLQDLSKVAKKAATTDPDVSAIEQQQQRQMQEEGDTEEDAVARKKHAIEKKQRRFLLDLHFEVQKVVNAAKNSVWNSDIAQQQQQQSATTPTTTTLRSVLQKLERTYPLTSMVCLDSNRTLYREDVVHGPGSLITFGTHVDGEPRSMAYDHGKCVSRGGVGTVVNVDSRQFAKKMVQLFCHAF